MCDEKHPKQTSIPVLGRPPRPRFAPENEAGADPFRAKKQKRVLPFSLPGPLSMMLGPDAGEQLGVVVDAVMSYATELLETLKSIDKRLNRMELESVMFRASCEAGRPPILTCPGCGALSDPDTWGCREDDARPCCEKCRPRKEA